jgi:hypothetical protein
VYFFLDCALFIAIVFVQFLMAGRQERKRSRRIIDSDDEEDGTALPKRPRVDGKGSFRTVGNA